LLRPGDGAVIEKHQPGPLLNKGTKDDDPNFNLVLFSGRIWCRPENKRLSIYSSPRHIAQQDLIWICFLL